MTSAEVGNALVTGAYSRRMELRLADGRIVTARIKGKRLKPVCGDRVRAEPIANESDWLLTDVMPRDNELTRPDSRGRTEILAANLSAVVVMAAPEPAPDWFVVDRYLAAAENMGADAVVVYNKIDTGGPNNDTEQALEAYRRAGYPVLACSARDGTGLEDLANALRDRVAIVVGQSGVGKSSMVNRLSSGVMLKTARLSAATGEGRHTTVSSVMIELPGGGQLIDSPGVRDYAPALDSAAAVIRGFREVGELGQACRFANCRHLREPDCAVKKAVDDGRLDPRRYESYRRLLRSAEALGARKY